MSTVETMEKKVRTYLSSLRTAALCGRSNKLQLPFSSLDKEFKMSRIREALLCQDSKVTSAGIMVRTGRR